MGALANGCVRMKSGNAMIVASMTGHAVTLSGSQIQRPRLCRGMVTRPSVTGQRYALAIG
ncbi:hypothetical protein Thivi_1390 [Thiocystis violascens DSM 198]|uniref:Uncharacterized protein n=1 Tax=Thiocystis violascens (strain ATCC 17096 / DSM 198 / 6111) TaxID=765911 RepID=I3Y8T0_THIV6|nr:hypothetical protein Thivi_1390 [Thiocystis violascens DSM 198]